MFTSGTVDLGSAKFYYEITGAGHPLVMVHAGIADCRMWDEQFPVFAKDYRVIRYDRRGFGNTPMTAGGYSHHRDLFELLEFLNIQHAHLLGCSQGSKTIIDFALENPERASTLILTSPALSGFVFTGENPRQWTEIEQAEEAGDLERVNELELETWVDGPQRTPDEVDADVRERVRLMNRIALLTPENLGHEQPLDPAAANRLKEIHAPTLIIAGALDTPRTLATADFLEQHISHARKEMIAGAAHMLNMEKPEDFNHLVLTFLKNQA